MIEHPHIAKQHISVRHLKDGTMNTVLVVETLAEPESEEYEALSFAVVQYMRTHDSIDEVEINCRALL